MSSKQSSTESKFSRGPRGGADVIGPLLTALSEKSELTTISLYWLVKDRIPPEKAALYWRPLARKYAKLKPLEDQLRIGGQRLTFEYLVMLREQGFVTKKRTGKHTAWRLTESGARRMKLAG
jgi:hypothetical protein